MRLLHTSDWHLGRLTYSVPRRPDHEAVHAEIIAIARDVAPDLIIHSGDFFDASMPSVDDMRLGIEMLDELAAVAPTVVLCGNHENPKLFALFERLRGSDRLRFIDKPRHPQEGGILDFPARGGQRIRLAAVPFVRNTTYIAEFADPGAWTSVYADNLAFVEAAFGAALHEGDAACDVPIFAAHLHVTGAVLANSERTIHIDAFATRPESIPPVSYAAFGHIHKPQAIGGRAWARYAGSPLQLDFGEVDEQKSIVFVEAEPGRNAHAEVIDLHRGRQLSRPRGTLETLAANAAKFAGSLALVTVEAEQSIELMDRVAVALPDTHILRLDVVDPSNRARPIVPSDAGEDADIETLFDAFVAERGAPDADNERVADLFRSALAAVRSGATIAIPELETS